MGTVRINTGQLLTDADSAKKAFQTISQAGREIGTGVTAGSKQAQASLSSLQVTAAGVARQLAGMFALPTAIAFTQSVQRTNLLVRALSGSEEVAAKRMDELRKLADRTNQSFVDITRSATQLLPAIGRNNVDLSQTVLLAQRLAMLDPAQGIEGASLAIRELLSGQTTSLAMRFELPKSQLRDLLEQAGGDPQAIINGLDQMVAQMGITEQTIVDMGESGVNAFNNLKGEVIETTAMAFEPFLNNAIIPLVEGVGDMVAGMRDLNPELLEIGGTLGGILATVLALNAAGMGSPGLNKLAVAGGAAFLGAEAGTAIARFGAESGGFQNSRLENVSQEEAKKVIGETFGQAIIIAANGLIELYGVFQVGITTFQNAFERASVTWEMLKLGFEMGAAVLSTGFENLKTIMENAGDMVSAALELMALDFRDAIADVIASLGELLKDLPLGGAVDRKGQALIDAATGGQSGRDAQRSALEQRAGADVTAGVTPVAEALQPFADRMAELLDILSNTPLGVTAEQAAAIASEVENLRDKLPDLARMLGLLGEESGNWIDRMREGLGGGGGTAPVAEPEEFTEEMLEAFGKFQQELADLEKKAADDRTKANKAARDQQDDALKKRNSALSELEKEGTKQRADLINKSNREAEDAEEDHQETLAEIQRRGMREAQRAAARFDAQGVFNALDGMEGSERVESQSYDKQRERREEQDRLELSELETTNAEKLLAIQAGYQEELLAINQQRQEKINQINAQLRDEIQQKNQAFAETHNRLVAEAREAGNHNVRMLNIQGQGLAAQEAAYRAWITRMGGYVPQVSPQQFTQASGAVQAAVSRIRIPSFAGGTGDTGMGGLAMLHPREIVGDATTAAMIRSLTGSQNPSQGQIRGALAAGNSNSTTQNFNGSLHFGDIGGHSEQRLKGLFMESWREMMEGLGNS